MDESTFLFTITGIDYGKVECEIKGYGVILNTICQFMIVSPEPMEMTLKDVAEFILFSYDDTKRSHPIIMLSSGKVTVLGFKLDNEQARTEILRRACIEAMGG